MVASKWELFFSCNLRGYIPNIILGTIYQDLSVQFCVVNIYPRGVTTKLN